MAKTKGLGSIKRFGPRYGRTVKLKLAKVEKEQRKKHKCPYCNSPTVKRVSVGIWYCKKCNSKFTGKAYTLSKKEEKKEEAL
ncbi:MAG: 50S ribosomal protein L37ae [Candidatus Nanoarchaeia archaeon]|nr:50S ribosomal protein L37ae [Candidatus Nanoarchaeia archaeon]